ncbi:hypothetical protein ACTFIR_006465 [Dictyostelium discoideum]
MNRNIHLYIFVSILLSLINGIKSIKVSNSDFSVIDITDSFDDLVTLYNDQYSIGGVCNKTSYIQFEKLSSVSLNESIDLIKLDENIFWLKVINTVQIGENQKFNLLLGLDNSTTIQFNDFFTLTCKERPVNIERGLVGQKLFIDKQYKGRYGILVHNIGLEQHLSVPGLENNFISNTFTQGYYDDSIFYTDVSKNYTIFKPVIQPSASVISQLSIDTIFGSVSTSTKLYLTSFLNSTYYKNPIIVPLQHDNNCSSLVYNQCSLLFVVQADIQRPGIYFLMNMDSNSDRPELVYGNKSYGHWLFTIKNIAERQGSYIYPISSFDSTLGFSTIFSRNISYFGPTGVNLPVIQQSYFGTQIQNSISISFSKFVIPTTVNYGDIFIDNGFNTLSHFKYPYFINTINAQGGATNTLWVPSSLYQKSIALETTLQFYFIKYPSPILVGGFSGIASFKESIPPVFENIEYFDSISDDCIVRISASDEGGSCIQSIAISFIGAYEPSKVQSIFRITNRNLIEGNCFKGIYQISIPKYSIRRNYFIEMNDYANNLVKLYPNNFYSGKRYLGSFPYKVLTLEDIESIGFRNNNIDLSNSNSSNVLYIKLKDQSISNLVFQFIPKLGIDTYEPNNKLSGTPRFYKSKWNSASSIYEVSFDLPARLPTGPVSYILNPIEIDSSIFYQYFGSPSELNVYSQIADIMGPIALSFNTIGNTTIPSINEPPNTIGFQILFGDYLNGISQVNITVTSDKTYKPMFKIFTLIEPSLGKWFQFTWEIKYGDIPQTFSISELSAIDSNGFITEFPNPTKVNPLMLLVELYPSFSIQTIGETPTDVTPPYLQVYHVNQLNIENYLDRTLQINFTVYDGESGIYIEEPPTIYFINDNVEIVSKQTTFLSGTGSGLGFFENVIFGVNITLPYLFGYPNGFLTQIHGIYDNKFNILGATPDIINQYNRGNSFINVTIGQSQPFIESFVMDIDGDLLTVNGLKFGILPTGKLRINGTIENLNISIPFLNNTYIVFDLKQYRNINDTNCQIYITNQLGFSSNEIDFVLKAHINVTMPPTTTPQPTSNPTVTPSLTANPTPLPTNSPPQCKNDCGGIAQGQCSNLGCICISPYIGIDCSSKVIVDIDPIVNNSQPEVITPYQHENSGNKFSTLVSIYSLRELGFDGKVENEYIFEMWNYQYYNNDNHTYFTSIKNKNDLSKRTNITVSIKIYKQLTTIQFAGENIKIQPSSIKYFISLSDYQFKSNLNTLDLLMYASIETEKIDDVCFGSEFGDSSSQLSSQYLKIQINDVSLYGEFIKRAIVDTHIVGVLNKVLTNSQVKGNNINSTSNGSSSQYISIQIPNYKNSVELDPNFSILLESSKLENSTCNKKQSGLTKTQLIGIIIGSTAGFILILIIVISIVYKKSTTLRINITRAKKFRMKKLSFK